MPNVAHVDCVTTGHGSWPPTDFAESASKTFVHGKLIVRVGDSKTTHYNAAPTSCSEPVVSGSGTVYVEGQAIGRLGDDTGGGGMIAQTTPNTNVFAGE